MSIIGVCRYVAGEFSNAQLADHHSAGVGVFGPIFSVRGVVEVCSAFSACGADGVVRGDTSSVQDGPVRLDRPADAELPEQE